VNRALAVGALLLSLSGCAAASDTVDPGETTVFEVAVGDCLNDAAQTGDVSAVPIVPCSEPHDSEIYAVIVMTDGEYPGDQPVVQQADDGCRAEFTAYIGVPAAQSRYMFNALYPTEDSWTGGDREILCRVALVTDGVIEKVTGSLKGVAE